MINGMYFFPSMAINSHLYLEILHGCSEAHILYLDIYNAPLDEFVA